jgi:hypothetical protein
VSASDGNANAQKEPRLFLETKGNAMKTIIGMVAAGLLTIGIASAQDTAKENTKQAGRDIKQAGKDTGHAAKHTGKAVAKETKKGVHKAAGATENGARKVKNKTSSST